MATVKRNKESTGNTQSKGGKRSTASKGSKGSTEFFREIVKKLVAKLSM